MLDKLKQIWYNLKIVKYYLLYKAFRQQVKIIKEIVSEFNYSTDNMEMTQDSVQAKYQQGTLNIKKKINRQLNIRDKNNYEATLNNYKEESGKELMELAREETRLEKRRRLIMESIIVAKGQDIKSDKDKEEMVDKRIADFYRLQEFNKAKQLLREAKSLRKEGKIKEAEEIEQEWLQLKGLK